MPPRKYFEWNTYYDLPTDHFVGWKEVFESDEKQEKEKEMINNIKWKVKDMTLKWGTCIDDTDHFDVELEGIINGPCGTILGVANAIEKKLNEPDKKDEEYVRYIAADIMATMALNYKLNPSTKLPDIKKVVFNDPATIVIWNDGTKTVVKAQNNELFDPEKGLTMAITKKALGNEGNYFDTIKKWVGDNKSESEAKIHGLKMDKKLAKADLQYMLKDKKATKADLIAAMQRAIHYLERE